MSRSVMKKNQITAYLNNKKHKNIKWSRVSLLCAILGLSLLSIGIICVFLAPILSGISTTITNGTIQSFKNIIYKNSIFAIVLVASCILSIGALIRRSFATCNPAATQGQKLQAMPLSPTLVQQDCHQ